MTIPEFKRLPALITRAVVQEVMGLPDDVLGERTVVLEDDATRVPFGMIGAVRGFARTRRKGRKRQGPGYLKYRRLDVARTLGPEWI